MCRAAVGRIDCNGDGDSAQKDAEVNSPSPPPPEPPPLAAAPPSLSNKRVRRLVREIVAGLVEAAAEEGARGEQGRVRAQAREAKKAERRRRKEEAAAEAGAAGAGAGAEAGMGSWLSAAVRVPLRRGCSVA